MSKRWSVHGGGKQMCTKFWLVKLQGRECLGDIGLDGRVILEGS
jgi:hypothetical protein